MSSPCDISYLVHFPEPGKIFLQELKICDPVSSFLRAPEDQSDPFGRGHNCRLSISDVSERRPVCLVRRLEKSEG